MKILHISNVDKWSGAEVALLSLVKNDKKNTHIILLPEGDFLRHIESNGFRYVKNDFLRRACREPGDGIFLVYFRHFWHLLVGNFSVLYHCSKIRPDIIQGVHLSATLYALLSKLILRIPLILWVHDILANKFRADNLTLKIVKHLIDVAVVVSRRVEVDLLDKGLNPNTIKVIYNGIDTEYFNPTPNLKGHLRNSLNIKNGTKIIGMVAALVPWKGHKVLISAMSELKKLGYPNDDWALILVGGGFREANPYGTELAEYAEKMGISKKVFFCGRHGNIRDFYIDMDVLVNASIEPEPFGLTVCEGMSMRLPVIASKIGGIPEILTDSETGWLVCPNNANALAKAIIEVLNAPVDKLDRIRENARNTVASRFSMANFVSNFQSNYLDVLKPIHRTKTA